MAYHYDRGYNNNYHHGGGFRGGFRNNQPRINENQVPQSKHTIFIRGLAGDITTDEIKEYIGERVGKISFDFVKQTQDRSKIFVAVRFEKREEAKEFMDSYSDREFMGYRCDLSWFRDIRRFCAYQRSKQTRSNSQRRRRRDDSDTSRASSKRSTPARGDRSGSRDKSRESRSDTRSVSRSRSRSRGSNRSRSRSRSRGSDRSRSRSNNRRSRSNDRRSRSVSRSSRRSNRVESRNRHNDSMDHKSDDEVEKDRRDRRRDSDRKDSERRERKNSERESKRESRSKRRRDESVSDDEVVEIEKPKKKNKEELPQIPLPPKAPATPPAKKAHAYIPPPTVDMELDSPKKEDYKPSPPRPTNPYHANQKSFQKEPSPANIHATSYSVSIEEESAPKMIIREPQPPAPTPVAPVSAYQAPTYGTQQMPNPYAQHANMYQAHVQAAAPVPVQQPVVAPPAPAPPAPAPAPPTPTAAAPQTAFVPRQVSKIEIVMPASLPIPPPVPAPISSTSNATLNGAASFTLDPVVFPKSHKLFGHLKAFQSALLSTVKYEAPAIKKEEEENLSSLRLSSYVHEEDTEETKALEREDKLARLSDEQMMRFHIRKKQFEAAFRNDCETYSVVTRALLAKDEALQFGLKMSLLENMEDLYKKMMQRVDDMLDQLLAMP